MLFLNVLCGLALIHWSQASTASPSCLNDPVRTVYEFDLGVAVENIAVRNTGQLIVTASTSGELYLLNTVQQGRPTLINAFNATSLAGIAEYAEDVFAVLVGVPTDQVHVHVWSVWSVNLWGTKIQPNNTLSPPPVLSRIVTIPEGTFLNGLSLLSSRAGLILVADALTGVVWSVNVQTGSYEVAVNNTLTAPGPAPYIGHAGTNGIHAHAGSLYLTNRGVFAKIPINPEGKPTSNGSVIAHGLNSSIVFDDFALDCGGTGYLAAGTVNSIEEISADGLVNQIVAGNLNSTAIAEPTAAAFGRTPTDVNVLYVTTAGETLVPVNGNIKIGGQVVAVTTNTRGCFGLEPYSQNS